MATFTNLLNTDVVVTDEFGVPHKFEALEKRSGLSNYFYKYTAAGSAPSPVLTLVGDLDGDGTIPVPSIPRETAIVSPGAASPYPVTADLTTAPNPAVAPTVFAESSSPRYKRVSIDPSTLSDRQNVGANLTVFLPFPTVDETTTDTDTGLDSTTTVTATTPPVKQNGRRATAEDAAANPAVTEGTYYTAFGVITVTDASPSQTGTYYFALNGLSTWNFVADDDNPVGLPAPVASGSAIVLATGVITFAAFTDGAAGDSISVDFNTTHLPNTAATLEAVVDNDTVPMSGLFYNVDTGQIALIIGDYVRVFNPDTSQAIS